MPVQLFHRRRPIYFVYAPQYAASGSTVMRGQQLSALAAATSLEDRGIRYVPVEADMRRGDVFLTKGALKIVDERTIRRWRRNRNRLFADPVDEELSDGLANAVDVIVAASRSAEADYRRRWPDARVFVLDHHVDPRVRASMRRASRHFDRTDLAYFGERVNTISSAAIEEHVDFVQVSTASQDEGWFQLLDRYNAHYAIRHTRALDRHKPFLKGFTAAACRANILVQDTDDEAKHWLPDDYPYCVRGRADEQSILTSIAFMEESFGGPEWRYAASVMTEVANRTSDRTIETQLVSLFA